MFFLFLRLCPWFIAGLAALLSWWQWSVPALYPWPLVLLLSAYALACLALLWRVERWKEGMRALFPTFIALVVIGFGHLLVETFALKLVTTCLFAFLPWLSLQLAWLLLYDTARYPARAFIRLHVALIPIGAWYLLATLQGVQIFFSPTPGYLALACSAGILLLLGGTIQDWHDIREQRWMGAGVLFTAHIVALLLLLPTSMAVTGTLGALLGAIPLRLKYLTRERAVSTGQLLLEGCAILIAWIGVLLTAHWV